MAFPPYPGQGKPLPSDAPYQGDWVVEDKVFICRVPEPNADLEFVGIDDQAGNVADGINVKFLAKQLEVTEVQLLDINRRRLLMVEWKQVPPLPGADVTIEYDFRTPTTGVRFNLCRTSIKGNA